MTEYLVYDVFTEQAFGGNQLAVIPNAESLPEGLLQKIATEFNFSETTFVFPPENPAHTAKVRIFTPTMEIPFAGHPTIGTAIALAELGRGTKQILELGVGPIPATVQGQRAAFTTSEKLQTLANIDSKLVARALGLSEEDLVHETHSPIQASLGLEFVFAELRSRQALADVKTVTAIFEEGRMRYPSMFDFAIFAYCRQGTAIDARMFAPLDSIPEAPATGSASACLGALLRAKAGISETLNITQGEDMGRKSHIQVTAKAADCVKVAGSAVLTMRGQLQIKSCS